MENRSFYNEILTEHNIHPEFKHDIPDADIELAGVNPSCGDNIVLKLKTDGNVITDGGFVGDGCAISQASADIMLGMIVGQKKEKALEMGRTFLRMIHGEATEEEIDAEIEKFAKQIGQNVEDLKKNLTEGDREYFKADVIRDKAVKFLCDNAKAE